MITLLAKSQARALLYNTTACFLKSHDTSINALYMINRIIKAQKEQQKIHARLQKVES